MKKYTFYSAALLIASGIFQTANAQILTITDAVTVNVNDATDTNHGEPAYLSDLGDNTSATANGLTYEYAVRERQASQSSDARRNASFLMFDTSSLTPTDVNAAGFSATFEIDLVGFLNGQNAGMDVNIGSITDLTAWNSTTALPDFHWINSTASETLLIDNIEQYNQIITDSDVITFQVDATTIVQGWVNGTNNGLALYGTQIPNGGYFRNASITVVPEASTYALLAGMLALTSVALKRRK